MQSTQKCSEFEKDYNNDVIHVHRTLAWSSYLKYGHVGLYRFSLLSPLRSSDETIYEQSEVLTRYHPIKYRDR